MTTTLSHRARAAVLLGAAVGGIVLGNLGDVVGRARALGISILFHSAFAGVGALVRTQEQMLVLRFLVGLGVIAIWWAPDTAGKTLEES